MPPISAQLFRLWESWRIFFFKGEAGIRVADVTGVQTCALPIFTSPENGAAAEEVPGDYAAQGFEIGFNSRYLMDILNQIEGDSVEVHLADAAAPTLIRENRSEERRVGKEARDRS